MSTIKKICVFPNDPLISYYNKGEIKEGYFNPKNFFDEIHIISLFGEELEEDKVQKLAGKAVLKIHKMNKANLFNYKKFRHEVISLVSNINPLLIRAFNSRVPGWLATNTALKLGIPLVISLHTNYDQQRDLAKHERNFFRYFKLLYSKKLEKYCLKNADAVICVYEFIVPYAKKMKSKNIQVIYNKVDTKKFSNNVRKKFFAKKPTIISVGRLNEQKNHRYLIQAMKNLDAKLLIIGDGPNLESLNKIIHLLNLENKVEIIKKVPNEELPNYYASCDLYVQPMENLGGIPIPVIEAMACGLPVVMSKHSNNYSEIIDGAVVFTENNPASFSEAINRILSNSEFKEELIRKSLDIANKINGEKMEEEELSLYRKLIDRNDS